MTQSNRATEIQYENVPHVDDPTQWPTGFKKWTPKHLYNIGLYFSCCLLAVLTLPNTIWDQE